MTFVYNDGGRAAAGLSKAKGDCVVRAIAIACGLPYLEVLDGLAETMRAQVRARREKRLATATLDSTRAVIRALYDPGLVRVGELTDRGCRRSVYQPYLESLGWAWTSTMQVGSGCRVHLSREELPSGRLIARLSRHLCAVVDGVPHDLYDPSRGGTRCVYGYFSRSGD